MTKPALGGYEHRQHCTTIRNSAIAINRSLARILDENVGQQTLYALLAKMAVEVSTITNAVNNTENIGDQAKDHR